MAVTTRANQATTGDQRAGRVTGSSRMRRRIRFTGGRGESAISGPRAPVTGRASRITMTRGLPPAFRGRAARADRPEVLPLRLREERRAGGGRRAGRQGREALLGERMARQER